MDSGDSSSSRDYVPSLNLSPNSEHSGSSGISFKIEYVIEDESGESGEYTAISDNQSSPNSDLNYSIKNIVNFESSTNEPFIQILEQPGDFRYRYEKEKYHGYIVGLSTPQQTKKKHEFTFPRIKIHNYDKDVIVRCWLISPDTHEGAKAHVHKLCRKLPKTEMKREPIDLYATKKNEHKVSFDYMFIVHAVGHDENDKEVYEKKRLWLESDCYEPFDKFQICSKSSGIKNIDKNQSMLLFDAFDALSKERICKPVFSRKIKNLHNPETSNLKIVNYSLTSGSCKGGDEVFMFVEKISKGVGVKFFSCEHGSNVRTWEENAIFGPQHIHHQYAIVFRTPKYKDEYLSAPVNVFIELYRETDGARSDPVRFTYKPDGICKVNDLMRKRPYAPDQELCVNDVLISSGINSKKLKGNISPDPTNFVQCPEDIDFERELGVIENISPNPTNCMFQSPEDIYVETELAGTEIFEGFPEINLNENMHYESMSWLPFPRLIQNASSILPDFTLLMDRFIRSDGPPKSINKQSIRDKKRYIVHSQSESDIKTCTSIPNQLKKCNALSSNLIILKQLLAIITRKEGNYIQRFRKVLETPHFDRNTVDFGGNTIFILSCTLSEEVVAELLNIEHLNHDMMNLNGDGALHCACLTGKVDIVKKLLEYNFDPNIKNYKTGDTPLHIAVVEENLPLVQLLIENGANPLANNYASYSPYDYSLFARNTELQSYLLKAQEAQGKEPKPSKTGGVPGESARQFAEDFSIDEVTSNIQSLKVTC